MAAAFVALHLALVACWWRWLTPRAAGLTRAARLLRSWSAVGGVSHSELFGGFGAMAPLLVVVFAAVLTPAAAPASGST